MGTVAVIEKGAGPPSGGGGGRGLRPHRAGAALWVEAVPVVEAEPTGMELAREYKSLISAELRRGAWQVIDAVERMQALPSPLTRPATPPGSPWRARPSCWWRPT